MSVWAEIPRPPLLRHRVRRSWHGGIRVGSVKDGKVTAYIPSPPGVDDKTPPPQGITVDSHGTIYAAAVQMKDAKKYTK